MASIALGCCGNCDKKLVYLAWREGKRKVIVGCDVCEMEMVYDLDKLLDVLGGLDPMMRMLQEFEPKGKAS